jgi:hypothetical protein
MPKLYQQISVVTKNMKDTEFCPDLSATLLGKTGEGEIVHDNRTLVFHYNPDAEWQFLRYRHLRQHLNLPRNNNGGREK